MPTYFLIKTETTGALAKVLELDRKLDELLVAPFDPDGNQNADPWGDIPKTRTYFLAQAESEIVEAKLHDLDAAREDIRVVPVSVETINNEPLLLACFQGLSQKSPLLSESLWNVPKNFGVNYGVNEYRNDWTAIGPSSGTY